MTAPKLAVKSSGYGGRGYAIPGREDQYGKRLIYPSVTTVLKTVNKPGLHQWIADQVAAYAVTRRDRLNELADDRAWSFLRFYWSREPELVGADLRQHHEGVRDDSAELGTNVHEIIEAETHGTQPPAPMGRETEEMLGAWDGWLETHSIEPLHAEFTVVNDWGYGIQPYAGTADADWRILCQHDRPCFGTREWVRVLVDLKTSRYTWNEHGYQLAAMFDAPITMVEQYEGFPGARRAEKTEDGVRIRSWWTERESPAYDRIALLHIRPVDLDPAGNRIEAYCELVDLTEDLDLYRAGFKGALHLARTQRALEQRERRRALSAGI